jgi:hypothetical protein
MDPGFPLIMRTVKRTPSRGEEISLDMPLSWNCNKQELVAFVALSSMEREFVSAARAIRDAMIFEWLNLSQSGHQLIWRLFPIGYFSHTKLFRYGDLRFYGTNEVMYKSKKATMVGMTLRAQNQAMGTSFNDRE